LSSKESGGRVLCHSEQEGGGCVEGNKAIFQRKGDAAVTRQEGFHTLGGVTGSGSSCCSAFTESGKGGLRLKLATFSLSNNWRQIVSKKEGKERDYFEKEKGHHTLFVFEANNRYLWGEG